MSLLAPQRIHYPEEGRKPETKQLPRHDHWTLPGAGESYESCGQLGWQVCDNHQPTREKETFTSATVIRALALSVRSVMSIGPLKRLIAPSVDFRSLAW